MPPPDGHRAEVIFNTVRGYSATETHGLSRPPEGRKFVFWDNGGPAGVEKQDSLDYPDPPRSFSQSVVS